MTTEASTGRYKDLNLILSKTEVVETSGAKEPVENWLLCRGDKGGKPDSGGWQANATMEMRKCDRFCGLFQASLLKARLEYRNKDSEDTICKTF